MADEVVLDQPANLDPQGDQSAQNPVEQTAGEVSPAAPQEDLAGRLAALESQFQRERERNELLENSLRIQERFIQQREEGQRQAPVVAKDDGWTPEHDVLDKALDPVLKKRLGSYVDPLAAQYQTVLDETDSLRFENYLQRNNPEILNDEDLYAQTMQQVEAVRQAGRQRGMNITRMDAFVFNEGLQGAKRKGQERRQKRTTATATESRRTAEVAAAGIGTEPAAPRPSAMAGIQAIRDKANRGERLSQDERAKLRDFVGNVEL